MTKTVASLCPWPVKIERPHFTMRNTFELPAVPKGQPPATTKIDDNVQYAKILSTAPEAKYTILGEEIAADFVKHVAQDGPFMTEDARPAVWICAGDEPTQEEIAANLQKLRAYCGLMVEYADDLDRRRQAGEPNVPKVTLRMKDAARFLDLKREWLTDLVNSATTCWACTLTIPAHAIRCPHCKEIVNQARYDERKKSMKSGEPVTA